MHSARWFVFLRTIFSFKPAPGRCGGAKRGRGDPRTRCVIGANRAFYEILRADASEGYDMRTREAREEGIEGTGNIRRGWRVSQMLIVLLVGGVGWRRQQPPSLFGNSSNASATDPYPAVESLRSRSTGAEQAEFSRLIERPGGVASHPH